MYDHWTNWFTQRKNVLFSLFLSIDFAFEWFIQIFGIVANGNKRKHFDILNNAIELWVCGYCAAAIGGVGGDGSASDFIWDRLQIIVVYITIQNVTRIQNIADGGTMDVEK